jgi:protein TonB
MAIYFINNYQGTGKKKAAVVVRDVQLEDVKKEDKRTNRHHRRHRAEPPKVEMAKFTPPKIGKDEEVKAEEKPPEVENWKHQDRYSQPGRHQGR